MTELEEALAQSLLEDEYNRTADNRGLPFRNTAYLRMVAETSRLLRSIKYESPASAFLIQDVLPKQIIVRRTNDPTHATARYSVIEDHGWAERIACSECSMEHAHAIAFLIAKAIGDDCIVIQADEKHAAGPKRG